MGAKGGPTPGEAVSMGPLDKILFKSDVYKWFLRFGRDIWNEISAIFSDTHRKNTELLDYINEYLKVL